MKTIQLESLTNKLIEELKKDSDIESLSIYHPKNDDYYDVYYSIVGFHKDNYFHLSIRKSKNNELIEIYKSITDNISDFKKYLKSKTDLKFRIV